MDLCKSNTKQECYQVLSRALQKIFGYLIMRWYLGYSSPVFKEHDWCKNAKGRKRWKVTTFRFYVSLVFEICDNFIFGLFF